ncbi:efflux RND transporter periplasmic adaptor subunit [Pseudomonas syringae pv. dysoxyli]|uniref:efflux RND transporter periplasmic adaptor subunit n=1 Tax=Pseudomonas syringae TaxID=317 RepID=UPI001372B4E3|nr:efflux RND transporter periplasmic adaptor subunit [Pseudomonas syringae]NAO28863.1 efflux RND transporter periplasmic adaptor subunit [Pseudomonas syringae pv. dysoxyli]
MIQRHRTKFFFIGLLPFAMAACNGATPPDPRLQVPLVRIDVVQPAVPAARVFTGIVAARVQSDLGFRVPGKVLERLVDTGQSVKRGQPLMRIDANDLTLTARAQQEAVIAAMARARQTSDDELRYRDLVSVGAVSASSYAGIKAAADSAKAQLNAAQAQANVARNATGYSTLPADADGVVVETLAEPGQVIGAGQVVVRVAHAGQREAVIQLPETLRPALGSPATVELYGRNQGTGSARLRQLSDSADRQTRTFEARYVLEGAVSKAILGSTISVTVADTYVADVQELLVPIGALYDAGKGPGVWVVEGEPEHVVWRPITVRSLNNEITVRVTGDLQVGDRVVALGAHLLSEGMQVRPETPIIHQLPVAEVRR